VVGPSLGDAPALVTGGAGFVGRHLVRKLLKSGRRDITVLDTFERTGAAGSLGFDGGVRVSRGSASDPDVVEQVMKRGAEVFHLASLWLDECERDPRAAVTNNVLSTATILEAARRADARRVIVASSASVYGSARWTPMDESHPLDNRTVYGATKVASEQIARRYADGGLSTLSLRFSNIYGPGVDTKGTYVGLVRASLERLSRGHDALVYGTGRQVMDLVYVDDVVRAVLLAATHSEVSGTEMNVCTGVGTSAVEAAERLSRHFGRSSLEFDASRSVPVERRICDPGFAMRALGFGAQVGLEFGLARTVEWFRVSEDWRSG